MRAYILVLAATLGGCSASEIIQNWAAAPAPDLSQPNYRRIVASGIKTILPNLTVEGDLEISDVRPVDHFKGAAWITCLRLQERGNPQHYAVFIQDNRIIDSRSSVVIDQCHKASYTLLEIPAPR